MIVGGHPCPVHDGTSRDCDHTEKHSYESHFLPPSRFAETSPDRRVLLSAIQFWWAISDCRQAVRSAFSPDFVSVSALAQPSAVIVWSSYFSLCRSQKHSGPCAL